MGLPATQWWIRCLNSFEICNDTTLGYALPIILIVIVFAIVQFDWIDVLTSMFGSAGVTADTKIVLLEAEYLGAVDRLIKSLPNQKKWVYFAAHPYWKPIVSPIIKTRNATKVY